MTIANYFTFLRILLTPVFLIIYVLHNSLGISDIILPYVLLLIMGLNEASDACDGYLARKLNQVTDFGKIVDPMADSISRLTYFLSFTTGPVQLPLLLVFVFLYRDAVISTLRTLCALRGFALAARGSGKLKAAIQFIAVVIILTSMIPHSLGYITTATLQTVGASATAVAAIFTLYSWFDYIYANRDYVKRLIFEKP
ncbi:CDP-diacylglycerol--glycerol-3-phosphate 3-phosphatidyltransferase [Chlamydiales bacterium SCGC AG-110-P3]|nr:CDP-diacylglycerol--glycerol-3-phosphate 3-phosphatidyltransferase [Chlamydiales bacterium SCGC AG-110-P3]